MHEKRVQALQQYLSELKELPVGHDKIKKVCAAIEEELGIQEQTTVNKQGITIHFNIGDDVPEIYVDGERVKYITDLEVEYRTRTEEPGKFLFLLKHWEDRLIRNYGFEK